MNSAIGNALIGAFGIAVSPLAVMAILAAVLSPRARAAAVGLLIGWVVGNALALTVFTLLAATVSGDSPHEPMVGIITIVIAAALLLLAVGSFRIGMRGDDPAGLPGWLDTLDTAHPVRTAVLGLFAVVSNPKNFLLALAAGLALGSERMPPGLLALSILIVLLVAVSSVVVPFVLYRAAPESYERPLHGLAEWLIAHHTAITSIVLFAAGVGYAGQGIAGL